MCRLSLHSDPIKTNSAKPCGLAVLPVVCKHWNADTKPEPAAVAMDVHLSPSTMHLLFRSPVNAESLASGSAGACEAIFTNPFEIIKIRLRLKDAAMRDAVCEGETFTKHSILWIVRNVAGEKSHSQQLFRTAGSSGRQRVLYDDPGSCNVMSLPGRRSDETIIGSPGYGQLCNSPPFPGALETSERMQTYRFQLHRRITHAYFDWKQRRSDGMTDAIWNEAVLIAMQEKAPHS